MSWYFYEVFDILVHIYIHNVKLLEKRYLVNKQIISNPKYTFYFDNCFKLLNKTSIVLQILYKKQT